MTNDSKMQEPIGGPSWPEERARYGEYEPGSTAPKSDVQMWDALAKLADDWTTRRINPTHAHPSPQRIYGDGWEEALTEAAGELRAVLSTYPRGERRDR